MQEAPSGKRGRQQSFSDAAIPACLTIKGLVGLPLGQMTGVVARLLDLAGLDWSVPGYSTPWRRLTTLAVQAPCRGSSGPPHLPVDSTGAGGRNDVLRAIKRFGRTLRRKRSGHHRRSRVETTMNCMELFGRKFRSRDFDRQTAKLQARIALRSGKTLGSFTACLHAACAIGWLR